MSEEIKDYKEAIESLIYQFGYRGVKGGKPCIGTGGLSALEFAFSVIGWDDPHFVQEEGNTCEIDGCMEEPSSGQRWDDLYLSLCYKHSSMLRNKEERPPVKQYAIKREGTRDAITGFLPQKRSATP
jgi:hypothetical protein